MDIGREVEGGGGGGGGGADIAIDMGLAGDGKFVSLIDAIDVETGLGPLDGGGAAPAIINLFLETGAVVVARTILDMDAVIFSSS